MQEIARILCVMILLVLGTSGPGMTGPDSPASITVHLDQTAGRIDPKIFGHFTEETLSSYEGGIWSELLFNRKFEVPEERDIAQVAFTGVAAGWEPIVLDTNVTLALDTQEYYSPSASQRMTLSDPSDIPAGIMQRGFQYVMPHVSRNQRVDAPFRFAPAERYLVRIAVKSKDLHGALHVSLGESYDRPAAQAAFNVTPGEAWQVHTGELRPASRVENGKFMVYITSPGTVWVDSVSLVRADLNDDGFRKDALELTRRITPTLIRWPGGWFASDYHWQDGIGPIDTRPVRFNRAWNAFTTNDVGTDEFVALCRKLGAEPYVTVNVGTGTPEEAARWVEYCNGAASTKMGRLRAGNGHPEPYKVQFWSIGNEEYLPTLGASSGRQYGRNFNAFAQAMRAVDPSVKLTAVGAFDIPKGILARTNPIWRLARYLPDWTREVLAEAGSRMDYYSIHFYAPEDVGGHRPEEVRQAALVIGDVLSQKLERVRQQMAQFAPGGKIYPIALDEWSLKVDNDPSVTEPPADPRVRSELGLNLGALSLREAVAEASVFNLMQRQPADFILGSRTLLYAYMVGLIPIRPDRAIATPPALMVAMYSTHQVCQSLKTEAASSTFATVAMNPGFPAIATAKRLDASARLHPDRTTVELFVINRDLEAAVECVVQFTGGDIEPDIRAAVLTGESLMARNTFDDAQAVTVRQTSLRVDTPAFHYTFPAHSLVRLTLRKK